MTPSDQNFTQEWLEYFGVRWTDGLDAGTLRVISNFIDEGRRPPAHAERAANAPTPPYQGDTSCKGVRGLADSLQTVF
jgi:hypothetical protein